MLKGDSHIDTAAPEHEEGPSEAHQRLSSRRTFLSGSAKLLGGGALALGLGAAPAFAKGNHDDDEDKKQGGKRNNGSGVSDVDILNYALVLERLEYEFYRRYLNRYNESQIEGASIFEGFGNKVRSEIYENLKRIRNHEKTHVETLIAVIIDLGGKPVGGESLGGHTEYDFGVKSVKEFVATAQVLEDTGVMAYDGAIAYIHRPGLQTASATIATVEARHASYLRLLNGEVPFPEPFDDPKAPRQVCELVDPFITNSPFNLKAFCESLPNQVITLPAS
jgi:rubrerythrin